MLTALQVTILPSIFSVDLRFDTLTPWLTVLFITRPLGYAMAQAVFGAILIETHSSAPTGLYISAYWMIGVVIQFAKPHISWQQTFPWAAIFGAVASWIIAYESFVLFVLRSDPDLGLFYILQQLARFSFIIALGMLLQRMQMRSWARDEP